MSIQVSANVCNIHLVTKLFIQRPGSWFLSGGSGGGGVREGGVCSIVFTYIRHNFCCQRSLERFAACHNLCFANPVFISCVAPRAI